VVEAEEVGVVVVSEVEVVAGLVEVAVEEEEDSVEEDDQLELGSAAVVDLGEEVVKVGLEEVIVGAAAGLAVAGLAVAVTVEPVAEGSGVVIVVDTAGAGAVIGRHLGNLGDDRGEAVMRNSIPGILMRF
jgi:hypothetical protein